MSVVVGFHAPSCILYTVPSLGSVREPSAFSINPRVLVNRVFISVVFKVVVSVVSVVVVSGVMSDVKSVPSSPAPVIKLATVSSVLPSEVSVKAVPSSPAPVIRLATVSSVVVVPAAGKTANSLPDHSLNSSPKTLSGIFKALAISTVE